MKTTKEKIDSIINQYDIGTDVKIKTYGTGIVNETWLIKSNKDKYILQKANPYYHYSLLQDIEVVTSHLVSKGIKTPQLVKTASKELGIIEDNTFWRLLTFIEGSTFEKIFDISMVERAANFVGRYHQALNDLEYKLISKTPNFHDTAEIVNKLNNVASKNKTTNKYQQLEPLYKKVLKIYSSLSKTVPQLPLHITHGDLKISNIIFESNTQEPICLIDLDTMLHRTIIMDLGDAAMNWCKLKNTEFNTERFQAMMKGYFSQANSLTAEEVKAIPIGIKLIILGLAVRNITDAFKETYFTLDKAKYKNLYEQNKSKALDRLNLLNDFEQKKEEVNQIIKKYV